MFGPFSATSVALKHQLAYLAGERQATELTIQPSVSCNTTAPLTCVVNITTLNNGHFILYDTNDHKELFNVRSTPIVFLCCIYFRQHFINTLTSDRIMICNFKNGKIKHNQGDSFRINIASYITHKSNYIHIFSSI